MIRLDERRGVVLLEVLIALAILGTAGAALLGALQQAMAAQVAARTEEEQMDEADRVLAAMTLLSGADLDRRIGPRPLGEFVVSVERPETRLYRIAVSIRAAPSRELIVTVVHRQEVLR